MAVGFKTYSHETNFGTSGPCLPLNIALRICDCDCQSLVAEVRNRPNVIRVCRADYKPSVGWDSVAVRRAIAAALHHSSWVFTNGLLDIEFIFG